jgi:hypothetical protein
MVRHHISQGVIMATKQSSNVSVANMSVGELQAKAAALRAARAAQGPAQSSSAYVGLAVGFGNFINSFGVMKDAYQLTRAERTGI